MGSPKYPALRNAIFALATIILIIIVNLNHRSETFKLSRSNLKSKYLVRLRINKRDIFKSPRKVSLWTFKYFY